MLHPNVQPKKFQFYVVVDPANKLLVPLATNKTVDDLIDVVKKRLRKKAIRNNNNPRFIPTVNNKYNYDSNLNVDDGNMQTMDNETNPHHQQNSIQNNDKLMHITPSPLTVNTDNNTNNEIDIDSLTTMYWVDAQTLKPKHIYVILRGTDKLQKLLKTYKSMITSDTKLTQFYWFIARSPSQVLNIANLRPMEIRMAPEEIRQKYHRVLLTEHSLYSIWILIRFMLPPFFNFSECSKEIDITKINISFYFLRQYPFYSLLLNH